MAPEVIAAIVTALSSIVVAFIQARSAWQLMAAQKLARKDTMPESENPAEKKKKPPLARRESTRQQKIRRIVISQVNQRAWLIIIASYTLSMLLAFAVALQTLEFCQNPASHIIFWISIFPTTILLAFARPLQWGLATVFTGFPHLIFLCICIVSCPGVIDASFDAPVLAGFLFVLPYILNLAIVAAISTARLGVKSSCE